MIKIFHANGTRSIIIIWLCEELNIDYRVELIPFTLEFRKSKKWRNLNPVGKVPVIKDGNLTIFESGAILQYLQNKFGNNKLQPSKDSEEYGLFLQWCWFSESTFLRPISEIVNHKRVFNKLNQSQQVLDDMSSRAILCLQALNNNLEGKEYIVGNSFTSADIMLGYTLNSLSKHISFEKYQNAFKYWQFLKKREGFIKAFKIY